MTCDAGGGMFKKEDTGYGEAHLDRRARAPMPTGVWGYAIHERWRRVRGLKIFFKGERGPGLGKGCVVFRSRQWTDTVAFPRSDGEGLV